MIEYHGNDGRTPGNVIVKPPPCLFRFEDEACPQHGLEGPALHRARIISIPGQVWHRYGVQAKAVQDAWPEASDGERELLVTGSHPDCWARAFQDAPRGAEGETQP